MQEEEEVCPDAHSVGGRWSELMVVMASPLEPSSVSVTMGTKSTLEARQDDRLDDSLRWVAT